MKLNVICVEHPDRENVIKEEPFGHMKHYLHHIYLDGIIEKINGYDCVDLVNYSDFGDLEIKVDDNQTVIFADIPDGIYDCSVYGYEKNCKAYIWKSGNDPLPKGLICAEDDDIANDNALANYNSKYQFI